jgi:hypothetical protein
MQHLAPESLNCQVYILKHMIFTFTCFDRYIVKYYVVEEKNGFYVLMISKTYEVKYKRYKSRYIACYLCVMHMYICRCLCL